MTGVTALLPSPAGGSIAFVVALGVSDADQQVAPVHKREVNRSLKTVQIRVGVLQGRSLDAVGLSHDAPRVEFRADAVDELGGCLV